MAKKIVVVGAWPGGTAAAMILANRGYDVTIVEKNDHVWGRNAELKVGEFSFDTGPTFLHTPWLIQEIFDAAGEKVEDHLDLVQLAPFNRIVYKDKVVNCHSDAAAMYEEIKKKFPGNEKKFHSYLQKESKLNQALLPCLNAPYQHWWQMFRFKVLRVLPHLLSRHSVYSKLGKFFPDKQLRMCMSFQTKYLGMTPWKCPWALSILSSWEYLYGVYHVQGGLCKLSQTMAKIAQDKGATLRLSSEVAKCLLDGKKITWVRLASGEEISADVVVMNADYGYAMTQLMGQKNVPVQDMKKKKFSCSTFMIYLGLDTIYKDEPHHQILMADDYMKWTEIIDKNDAIPDDMAVYVRNSSVTDPHVAPEWKSGLYILVPVPNTDANHDWKDIAPEYREKILDRVEERTGMKDLRKHIVAERQITPDDWEHQAHVFIWATFSIRHTLNNMLYLRPHNKYERFDNLYLVGGNTHPGSGIVPIIQSALISANLITKSRR